MNNKISNRTRILDISLNLARIGSWVADSYEQKQRLIQHFMRQTDGYFDELQKINLPENIQVVLQKCLQAFRKLQQTKITSTSKDAWAETALTWANILQHRAKFA